MSEASLLYIDRPSMEQWTCSIGRDKVFVNRVSDCLRINVNSTSPGRIYRQV